MESEQARIAELERQNAIMRAALREYANRYEWGGISMDEFDGDIVPTLNRWEGEMYIWEGEQIAGGWSVAQAALEEAGNESNG